MYKRQHETFSVKVQRAGWAVGYDPSVRVRHHYARSEEYTRKSERNKETQYLQYLCRNFPRLRKWDMPFWILDCDAHTMTAKNKGRPSSLEWGATDDASTVEYRPAKVSMFVAVLSARGHTTHRDALRHTWLRSSAQRQAAEAPPPMRPLWWHFPSDGALLGNAASQGGTPWLGPMEATSSAARPPRAITIVSESCSSVCSAMSRGSDCE